MAIQDGIDLTTIKDFNHPFAKSVSTKMKTEVKTEGKVEPFEKFESSEQDFDRPFVKSESTERKTGEVKPSGMNILSLICWYRVNPIPTSQGRNQPLYERHVTKSGRNRAKGLFNNFVEKTRGAGAKLGKWSRWLSM